MHCAAVALSLSTLGWVSAFTHGPCFGLNGHVAADGGCPGVELLSYDLWWWELNQVSYTTQLTRHALLEAVRG
jgi:hypothetical protein